MKFTIYNKQNVVFIDEEFWKRAFNYAARELQIEYHHAEIDCYFGPVAMGINKKFKGVFKLGFVVEYQKGPVIFLVAIPDLMKTGQMVKTFFHEMTYTKQYLNEELIDKPRHRVWKGEKWPNKEYSDAPWEVEANACSDKFYAKFLAQEVTRAMRKDANAYQSVMRLHSVFPAEEVHRCMKDREQIDPLDWETMSKPYRWYPELNYWS